MNGQLALQEIQEGDNIPMLKRIPLLVGFRTSQFRDILQFHNPNDTTKDGKSVTYFIDGEEEPGQTTFRMGGLRRKTDMWFQSFDSIDHPDLNLLPGNEIVIHPNHFDYYDRSESMQEELIQAGFTFQN